MAAADVPLDRTYGNWRRPKSPGIWHLGTIPSVLLMGLLIAVILTTAFVGVIPALILLAALAPVFGVLLVPDRHGSTMLHHAAVRVGWWRSRLARAHRYRSGPAGHVPWGTCQLPGLLARTQLGEARDSYERPFALIHWPQTAHYTVVIACQPDGAALVDQRQVDAWVAHWGHWLADLGDEPGVVAASVTIETAPDSGARLRHALEQRADPNAPAVAKRILDEIQATYPSGAASTRAWVALTFTAIATSRRRQHEEMAQDLAARLPALTQRLHSTGAGASAPVTAQELCEIVRVAYDPHAATLLDEARAVGQVPELRWSDSGPAAADALWDRYVHEGGCSVTWAMTAAPRGEVRSSVLAKLLAPHRDIARKRVTLLYRVIDPAVAASIVESDLRTADFAVHSAQRPSARALVERRAAAASAQEEARGANLTNFGALITATTLGEDALPGAIAAIDNLAATARLTLRRQYGSQDSAFAAALPLGLVLPAHLKVPEGIRSAL